MPTLIGPRDGAPSLVVPALPVAAGQWVHPAADAQPIGPPTSPALELDGGLAPLTSRSLRFLLSFGVVQEAISAFLSVVGLVMEWIHAHPANDPMPAGSPSMASCTSPSKPLRRVTLAKRTLAVPGARRVLSVSSSRVKCGSAFVTFKK